MRGGEVVVGATEGARCLSATYYSVTSSSTILTYKSNPFSVPTSSLSLFRMTQSFDPMHLSMSSDGRRCDGLGAAGAFPFFAANIPFP